MMFIAPWRLARGVFRGLSRVPWWVIIAVFAFAVLQTVADSHHHKTKPAPHRYPVWTQAQCLKAVEGNYFEWFSMPSKAGGYVPVLCGLPPVYKNP